ncbi:MAG: hypothetical protein IJ538_01835 [Clostridia bacterium]|nr:hypothetical protein [Clostridia bacterium]
MKKKNFKSISNIIISIAFVCLSAILLCVTPFISNLKASALSYGVTNLQTQDITISTVGTTNLYGNGESLSYWSYHVDRGIIPTNDYSSSYDSSTVKHDADSASNTSKADGYFYMIVKLSNNLQIAGANGYASLIATANVKSGTNGSRDVADKLYGSMDLGSADSLDYEAFSSSSTVNDSNKVNGTATTSYKTMKFNAGNISSQAVMLKINSSYVVGSGIFGRITHNIIYIQKPTITVSSTDTTKPTITIPTQNWTNENRTLPITVEDTQSGICKIEVSVNGGDFTEIVNYAEDMVNTKKETINYVIESNGNYVFRATDNVGNVQTKTYTESKIDKVSPTLSVEINDLYTEKSIEFSAALGATGISADTFEYTYSFNGVKSALIQLQNGTNSFIATENGDYTFEFNAYDESGNKTAPIVKHVVIDDTVYTVTTEAQNGTISSGFESKRGPASVHFEGNDGVYFYKLTNNGSLVPESEIVDGTYNFVIQGNTTLKVFYREKVELDIAENYIYSPLGLSLNYVASLEGNYEISFEYFNADKSMSFASISNVGTYVVEYNISNDEYFGNGEKQIVISPKQIIISEVVTTYEYVGSVLNFEYNSSEDSVPIEVEFTINGEVKDFVNAGTYHYEFKCSNSNYLVEETGTATIVPHTVQITISQSEFEYDSLVHKLVYTLDTEDLNLVETYEIDGTEVLPKNAGEYSVSIYQTENPNYILNFAGILKINKREITVSVNSQTITYGETFEDVTYSVENSLDLEPVEFNLIYTLNLNAGYYPVTFKQSQGFSVAEAEQFKNYNLIFVNGYLEVLKKPITVYPTEKQLKVYGEADPVLTYSVSGLVNGDTLMGSLSREEGENNGYYNITIGTLSNDNYEISLVSEAFQILKRVAFVKIKDTSKVYGNPDPQFEIIVRNSNILSADLEIFENAISRTPGEDIGTYEISFDKSLVPNYTVITVSSVFKIFSRAVTVVAHNVSTIYGETAELTYDVFDMADGDVLVGSLSREPGEDVGTYEIEIGSLEVENCKINFIPASYTILKRAITVTAKNATKVYGDADLLEFEVSEPVDTTFVLTRQNGEDVGTYEISGISTSSENYEITFVPAVLEITKKHVDIEILNKSKVYGESDVALEYVVSEANFVGEVELSREAGENAGNYEINLVSFSSSNFELNSVSTGVYEIKKAKIEIVIEDAETIYTGEVMNQCEIDSEYALEYVYLYYGSIEAQPINAGEYTVQAFFAGDENHEATSSNVATLTILKKYVPVVIKQTEFVYNGNEQNPEYSVVCDDEISTVITYADGILPIEIGTYDFTISSNDPNYMLLASGTIEIKENPEMKVSEGIDLVSSVSSGNSIFGAGISVYENNSPELLSVFNALRDGRKTVSAYKFNIANEDGGIYEIAIKSKFGASDVKIYIIDEDNNMVATTFKQVDGNYIITVNEKSGSILITEVDRAGFYLKIIFTAAILVSAAFVSIILLHKRKVNFIKRNTKYVKSNNEQLAQNSHIVSQKIRLNGTISLSKFIK